MRRCCDACGRSYEAKRASSRYCQDSCRKRGQRAPKAAPKAAAAARVADGELTRATVAELRAFKRLDTPLGRATLIAARRLDSQSVDTGSSIASLLARYQVLLADAVRGAKKVEDSLDATRRKVALKLVSGD